MSNGISGERRGAFYLGTGLMVVGFLLFASTFVTFAIHFGDFTDFETRVRSGMFRTLGGMALMVVGGFVRGIGARGLAGSGVVLDPEKARQDLKPYTRMAGGMVGDALEAADIKLGGQPEKIIMIKCPCGKLNDHDARFCQECGKAL